MLHDSSAKLLRLEVLDMLEIFYQNQLVVEVLAQELLALLLLQDEGGQR